MIIEQESLVFYGILELYVAISHAFSMMILR